MKQIFFIIISVLSYTALSAQTYLPTTKNSNAHNDYFLKGKPESLYHRTFELSKDSLTGEFIIGKEFDSLSDSSFRIYFTNDGDVQEFHHIYNGTSSTSLRYFYDPEKRYCVLQTYLNSPESYQRNWIENYQSSDNTQSNVYNLIQEEYYMSDFGDSLLLTNRDTILCIEKDGIFLSYFFYNTNSQCDNYPAKDSLYYAQYIDSCRNNVLPQYRTINLYNEQEQIVTQIEYTPISKQPSYMEYYYYNEQGLLISHKRLIYITFDEFGEYVYSHEPQSDIFRYEYPDNSIDEQGNWTKRYVFRQFRKEKEQPLYLECRQIDYIK